MSEPDNPSAANDAKRQVHVLAVKGEVYVRFLGPYQGLLTHWSGGRSYPCHGPAKCPIALHRARQTWKGYAPVEHWNADEGLWWPAVLEVTELLEETLRGRLLRGEVWCLTRAAYPAKSAPVQGLLCSRIESGSLRKAFDVQPVLHRFYHVAELVLGTANPMPDRLLMEPANDPSPPIPSTGAPEAQRVATPDELAAFIGQIRAARECRELGQHAAAARQRNGQAAANRERGAP